MAPTSAAGQVVFPFHGSHHALSILILFQRPTYKTLSSPSNQYSMTTVQILALSAFKLAPKMEPYTDIRKIAKYLYYHASQITNLRP